MKKRNKFMKLLAVLMAVAVCVTCVPVTSISSQAAQRRSTNFYWQGGSSSNISYAVEVGMKKLDMSNLLYSNRYGYLSDSNMMAKTAFSSSNKKVATINANGIVSLKKTGTTKITAKIGSQKAVCTLKVIKNTKNFKAEQSVIKAMNSLYKKYGNVEITEKNRAAFAKSMYSLNTKILSLNYKLTKEKSTSCIYGPVGSKNLIAIPDASPYTSLLSKLSSYRSSLFSCDMGFYANSDGTQVDYGTHIAFDAAVKKNANKIKINFVDTKATSSWSTESYDAGGYYTNNATYTTYTKTPHTLTANDIFALTTLEKSKNITTNPSTATIAFTVYKECKYCKYIHYDEPYTTATATVKKGQSSTTMTFKKKLAAGTYTLSPVGSTGGFKSVKFVVK